MAIYHLEAKIIGKRNQGKATGTTLRTVVAAAAYRAGEQLKNLANGQTYDYRKKQVVHTEILLAKGAPLRWRKRQTLWNEVEAKEKRSDAQYCRELVLALPEELSQEDRLQVVRQYIQKQFVDRGMCADIAHHDPEPRQGLQRNPHAHVMLTMRHIEHGRFGNKIREWDNRIELLEQWRESWARECNELLARRGIDARIDHRSLKDQGLDREPTVHLGVEATSMERKGIRTAKGNLNRTIGAYNSCLSAGVKAPNLLSGLNELWQAAADQRSKRTDSPKRSTSGQDPKGRGTADPEVQRRTYTLSPPMCATGVPPVPGLDGENAPRGAKTEQEPLHRQGKEGGPSGTARQPHEEKDTGSSGGSARPQEEKATGKKSFKDRLEEAKQKVREQEKPAGSFGLAKYDIKVITSMSETMLHHGVSSYAELEDRVAKARQDGAAIRRELQENGRLRGVCRAGTEAGRKADQLRGSVPELEKLYGATIRCQANRQYAEGYMKTIFKANYMKKYEDKLETYYRAARLLHEAGYSDDTHPQRLRPALDRQREELKRAHGKYLWAVRELEKAGLNVSTPEGMQKALEELLGRKDTLTQQLRDQSNEQYRWESIKKQLDNIHGGKSPRRPSTRSKPREPSR